MDRSAIFWLGRLVIGGAGIVLMCGAVRLLGRARAAANWPTAAPVGVAARPLGYTGIGAGLLGIAAAAALSLGALAGPVDPAPAPHSWQAWLVATGAGLVVVSVGGATTGRLVDRAEVAALIRTPTRPVDEAMIFRSPPPPSAGRPGSPEDAAAVWLPGSADDTRQHGAGSGGGPGGGAVHVLATPAPRPAASAYAGRVVRDREDPGQREFSTPVGRIDPVVPSGGRSGWVYRDPAGDWYLAVGTEGGQRLVRLADFALVPVGLAGSPLTLEGSVEISVWPVTDGAAGSP